MGSELLKNIDLLSVTATGFPVCAVVGGLLMKYGLVAIDPGALPGVLGM